MVKKLSTLVLAGLLALPVAAFAIDEDEFEELQEKVELSSRFQWSGDIRSRLDYHSADTASYFKATEVAKGIEWFANPNAIAQDADLAKTINAPNSLASSGTLLYGFGLGEAGTEQTLGSLFYGDPTAVDITVNPGADGTLGTPDDFIDGKTITGTLLPYSTRVRNLATFMKTFSPAQRLGLFQAMGFVPTPAAEYENDTLMTTRLRLNMRVKATENVEVKARLVSYKTWGMQDSSMPEVNENGVHDTDSPYFLNSRTFDGTSTRQPQDNILRVDRAYMNWNNIGGMPIWFSIGRRPTTDGPPSQLRLGVEKRLATPVAFMNYAFDGLTLGYAYNSLFGLTDAPGRIRFCGGRGFEAGPNKENTGINDADFGGLSWDIYKKGDRFINIQSFGVFNLFNVPGDTFFPNPLELAAARQGLADGSLYQDPATGTYNSTTDGSVVLNNTFLDRANMGNVYHTSGVYMDKYEALNYFVAFGWSRAKAKSTDELGITLLGDFWAEPETKDGYAVYVGGRYDIPNSPFKFGVEYNYGTKNWLGFTPGHDDIYPAKLYTRGSVYEVYGIWDIPSGEAVSKFGKSFIRLGYQHYDYDYTYSGMWLGTPTKIEDIKNDPLSSQFYAPLDSMDNIYLTFEAFF